MRGPCSTFGWGVSERVWSLPLPEETPEHRPLFPPSSDRSGTGEPFGRDEILDFQPGEDAIELRGFAGLDDFRDLAGAISYQVRVIGSLTRPRATSGSGCGP